MKILCTPWGPEITYDGDHLHVEDINPSWTAEWKLTRWEMAVMGMRLIGAALFHLWAKYPDPFEVCPWARQCSHVDGFLCTPGKCSAADSFERGAPHD